MISRVPLIWLALLAMLLSGCDSAEDLVNRRLPPLSDEPHHAAAIQAAQVALAGLDDANAGFNFRIEDIAAAVKTAGVIERLGVARLRLRGDRQLILAEADVTKAFSKDDFPDLDADTKSQIEILKPEIKGRISLGLGVAGASADSEDGRLTIDVRLLPLFRNMEVEHVTLAGDLDIDLVITLMNRLADKVAGELSRTEIAKVSIPAIPFKQADLSRALAFKHADGADANIAISAKPLSSSVYMRSLAWLVDGSNVTFIAELAPSGTAPVAGSATPGRQDFAQLQAEFARKLMDGLGIANPGDHWIAVSKQLVAGLVTAAFGQGQPCFGMRTALPDRNFSNPVTIPDTTTLDCTPEIDCTPTKDCSAARNCRKTDDECRQARDCRVCALGACFNDPACEREKTGAQYDCEVGQALRMIKCELDGASDQSVCERERAGERAVCETRKSATRLSCEAGRESIGKLMAAGNFAKVAGRVGGSADISVCVKEFAVAPSLERLEASATVSGEGAVDLGLDYVPQDIAGYYACPFSWPEDKHIEITLPGQPARIDAALTLETSASSPALRANIKTSAFAAHMRPGPRELLLESYDMRAVCSPVGAMLNKMTLDVTPAIPEIDGDFSLPGEDRALVMALEPMTFRISGTNVIAQAAYVSNSRSLILNADLPAVPAN
ncbi:MAG: hypothetical protein AB7F74_21365 [Parvibaculaceae bacterium]